MQPDPSVLPVPNLHRTAHTELASPSHRKGSSKRNPCITRICVSRDPPYEVFQAHTPQRIWYQWETENSGDQRCQPGGARCLYIQIQERAAERWRASSAIDSQVSSYHWCPFFQLTHNPCRRWGLRICWWCRGCRSQPFLLSCLLSATRDSVLLKSAAPKKMELWCTKEA